MLWVMALLKFDTNALPPPDSWSFEKLTVVQNLTILKENEAHHWSLS
jgi:hypothetical protein